MKITVALIFIAVIAKVNMHPSHVFVPDLDLSKTLLKLLTMNMSVTVKPKVSSWGPTGLQSLLMLK